MSKKKKGPPQIHPKCIFCNSKPLSEEHFWPDWMKVVIPSHEEGIHARILTHKEISFPRNNKEEFIKLNGPPGNFRHKIVCSTCNNGWMSQIENDAQPILLALMLDHDYILTRLNQIVLSKWVFLKVIIGEHNDKSNINVTKVERRYFYDTREIPHEWKFWIGRLNSPRWIYQYSQSNNKFNFSHSFPQKSGIHKSKAGTFLNGSLVIHIGKFSLREFSNFKGLISYEILGELSTRFEMIYPRNQEKTIWHKMPTITYEEARSLDNNLEHFTFIFQKTISI